MRPRSAIIEQDYDSLPGLCNIERDIETDDPAQAESEVPAETEVPAESAASEPPPPPESSAPPQSGGAGCNRMQHDSQNFVAPPAVPRQGLRSCPVPPDVLKARNDRRQYLEILDMTKSVEQTPIPKIKKEHSPADPDADANEEEILA